MERKQGESINQWRRRVRAQKKEDSIQKEIERVKNQEDYGGELNPAVLIYDTNQKEEKQKEFEDKIKAMQERTAGLSEADSATD